MKENIPYKLRNEWLTMELRFRAWQMITDKRASFIIDELMRDNAPSASWEKLDRKVYMAFHRYCEAQNAYLVALYKTQG